VPSPPEIVYDQPVQVDKGRRVRIRVTLTVVGGETIEKNEVEYIHGAGKMLPGLEAALAGLEAGAGKRGVLAAKDAFGDPALSPRKTMKRGEFPKEAQLTPGGRFSAKGANGVDVVLAIDAIDGDNVEVRLRHPLADKDIEYAVEVLSVTDTAPPPVPADAVELVDG
jgi:FKBP-type peptidyl-prolyl cis-trans isomerase 2